MLAHTPPVTVLLNVVVEPTQVASVPVIVPGVAFTVITARATQLPPIV